MSRDRRNLLLFAVVALSTGTALLLLIHAFGATTQASRDALRVSGRASFLLFLLPFTASALHRLAPGAATRWLLGRRRELGVSFAALHTGHLVGIIYLLGVAGGTVPGAILALGGVGYAFVLAMLVTSFDGPRRALGSRRWSALHRAGIYYLAAIFAYDFYGGMVLKDPVEYAPLAALLTVAFGLRAAARLTVSSARPSRS